MLYKDSYRMQVQQFAIVSISCVASGFQNELEGVGTHVRRTRKLQTRVRALRAKTRIFSAVFLYIWPLAGPNIAKRG